MRPTLWPVSLAVWTNRSKKARRNRPAPNCNTVSGKEAMIDPPSIADLDDGLDNTRFRHGVRRKDVDQLVERGPVRDPRARVDRAVLDQSNDACEVGRQGVARAEKRPLRLVKHRMTKMHFVRRDADEDEPAAV